MTRNQFLLLKLIEECSEVSHRASKQLQFGKDGIQKDQDKENSQRLKEELLDLNAVVSLLVQAQEIERFHPSEFDETEKKKKQKMQKYLDISHQLGQLPEITL